MAASRSRSRPVDRSRKGRRAPLATETLRIESLAAGGAGFARLATGEAAFITRVAAGELVEAALEPGKSPARGVALRVIEASPDRVEPVCPVVEACGGCDWMHLSTAAQEAAHLAIVEAAVAHAIAPRELPLRKVHPAPSVLRYRTRARLFAAARRGEAHVGYRAAAANELVEISACAVLDPAVERVIADLPAALATSRGEGDVSIALGAGGLPVVEIAWRGELSAAAFGAVDRHVTEGRWAGARVVLTGATTPLVFGDPRGRMLGADGLPLVIAGGSFAQPSEAGAHLLARRVAELAAIGATKPRHVLELFAGSGTLSILLARGSASFSAIEVSPDAAQCLRDNLASRDLAGKVTVADADAFAIPARADVVVLDPPRTGARGAARAIAASSAREVVYVACDPATLARDLATFSASGFDLTALETFELFPQTSHVETVARLVRTGARAR